jgi:signal transduction histidine kinase
VIAEYTDNQLLVKVEDSGIGIREEDKEKVFEEFRQIESIVSKKYKGTGLGMTITKKYVEMHGGRIWFESQFGNGTTFAFTLPVKNQ